MKVKILLYASLLFCPWGYSAQHWVIPMYPTGATTQAAITIETLYKYQLQSPKKGFEKVRLKQKKYTSMKTPEEAFVARMSAVSSLDYQWWIETWSESAKNISLPYFQNKGLDEAYWIKTWKNQFVGRQIRFVHKVTYKDYQIIIYNVSSPNGDLGVYYLPVVFKQAADGNWKVSLDLKQVPLLRISPWVKGLEKKEEVYE
ncbi:hypothetical protein [Gayadomonas joobiniege]|uniref:hypothetical protein n=1 Tax=Gayadomonas joobiniege TaxID=1234606 RepID=UPI000365B247|nr:hypothetical protein [Gayadomonas joobiniege]